MCVIMIITEEQYRRHTKKILGYLETARSSNPHGVGIWLNTNNVFKGVSLSVENKLKQTGWSKAVIHYRYSTQGAISKTNCHPFWTGSGWLFHNGVYSHSVLADIGGYNTKELSDTNIVASFFRDFNIPLRNQLSFLKKQSSRFVLVADKIYHNLDVIDKDTGIIASNNSYKNESWRGYTYDYGYGYNYSYTSKRTPSYFVLMSIWEKYFDKASFRWSELYPYLSYAAVEKLQTLSLNEIKSFLSAYNSEMNAEYAEELEQISTEYPHVLFAVASGSYIKLHSVGDKYLFVVGMDTPLETVEEYAGTIISYQGGGA